MPVGNGVLDTVGFLFAGQLAHQLQRKGDGTRTLGAAQMAATFLPAAAKALQVSVTVLLAARLGVPGMPPGSTTRSTSE